jgi:hypothetical protein
MIRYFSALYAGHVLEGEGVGFSGTPAADRWCTNERFIQAFEIAKDTAPLGMLRYNDQQMAATGPGGVARHIAAGTNFEEVLEKQAWFCGTPAETVAYLQKIEARSPGLEHILLGFPMGASLSQFKEQLACFAHEVMPAFKKTAVGV